MAFPSKDEVREMYNSSSSVKAGSSSSVKAGSSSSVKASSSSKDYCKENEVSYNKSKEFCDSRDGNVYRFVTMDEQVWMAENLNYNASASSSRCYGEDGKVKRLDGNDIIYVTLSDQEIQENCEKYGRLYNWETANTACPSGWRLPSQDEWNVLVNYQGDYEEAGIRLKAEEDWIYAGDDYAGKDLFDFTALPGGSGYIGLNVSFNGDIGYQGHWWSTEKRMKGGGPEATAIFMYHDNKIAWYESGSLENLFSVRCIKNQ